MLQRNSLRGAKRRRDRISDRASIIGLSRDISVQALILILLRARFLHAAPVSPL